MGALAQFAAPAARRGLSGAGVGLLAAGIALLGWLGWRVSHPEPAPYAYQLVAEGAAEKFPELGLGERTDFTVRKYELRAQSVDGPAVLVHVASRPGAAPVLLGWRNRAVEPVLAFDTRPADVAALAQAFARHAPAGAKVLAWWDTSRQLKLLAGAWVLYDDHLGRPLMVPGAWRGALGPIEALERAFWQAAPPGESQARLERYVDALVSPAAAAVPALRELAGPGEAYVVVQLADAFRAGMLRPQSFGIGYRDFPKSARLHGAITSVKAWLKEQGYESYAVEALDERTLRVYFLTNAASREALIAKLLPFTSANPFALEGTQVVHQQGPYWVYKLAPG